jgi:chromosome segregation ATPase
MKWGEWVHALAGFLTRAHARRRGGRRTEGDPDAREAHRREIQRLEDRLETLRDRRREVDAAFASRHAIAEQFPRDGGLALPELERRLANLRQIREGRLRVEEEACERRICELERQLEQASDHP